MSEPSAITTPLYAFRQWFRDPDGWDNLGWNEPTWAGERKDTGNQQVLTDLGIQRESGTMRYSRYGIQLAVYNNNRATAQQRAMAAAEALQGTHGGKTSGAPGLALDGWTAQQLEAGFVGVIEGIPVTGGVLYMAVTHVWLVNVVAT